MQFFICKIKYVIEEYFESGDIKFVYNNGSLFIVR